MAAPDPGPETTVVGREARVMMAEAIASLPPVERSVITLAYGAHLSQVEIAARLGWPIGTVKTRTRRALRHLRERMVRPKTGADGTPGGGMNGLSTRKPTSAIETTPAVRTVRRVEEPRHAKRMTIGPRPDLHPDTDRLDHDLVGGVLACSDRDGLAFHLPDGFAGTRARAPHVDLDDVVREEELERPVERDADAPLEAG